MKRILLTFGILLFASGIVLSQTPRLTLFEEFTGENCPPCASTNPGLNIILADNAARCVAIKWQVPIPSAPTKTWSLYQTNKAEITWRSGYVGNTFAPEGRIDGQKLTVFGASSDHAVELDSNVIKSAAAVTSPFSINMSRKWNHSCSAVILTITVQASNNFNATGNLIFRTVMVERLIQFSVAPGTNGEKTFHDAAIKSFPTISGGTPLQKNWTNGQSVTFTLTCELPSYVRSKSEVAFVGFIQDDGNKKVMQAFRLGTDVVPAESLSQVSAETENLVCTGMITPTVSFKNEGPTPITSATIIPFDGTVAGPSTIWTGNLTTGNDAIVTLNSMPVGTVTGNHNFSYDVYINTPVYNMLGARKTSGFVVVSGYDKVDVKEGFVSTFPPVNWSIINGNVGITWGKTGAAGGFNLSSNSALYGCFSNLVIGDVDEMFLPPVDLTSAGDPQLSFDIAYTTRNGRNDQLQVMASDDCGKNWKIFYDAAGAQLATVSQEFNTSWFPDIYDATNWRDEKITLTGMNKPEVLVKFVVTNENGNNLFLDNINLTRFDDVGIRKNQSETTLSLYPNPSKGKTVMTVNTNSESMVKINVINAIGQICYEKETKMRSGRNEFTVGEDLPSSVYSVTLREGNELISKKLIIVK